MKSEPRKAHEKMLLAWARACFKIPITVIDILYGKLCDEIPKLWEARLGDGWITDKIGEWRTPFCDIRIEISHDDTRIIFLLPPGKSF